MKLFRDEPLFAEIHRSGWPHVWAGLRRVSTNSGTLLDDFTDGTFLYAPASKHVHVEPWVGIFHHPVHIQSVLPEDKKYDVRNIAKSQSFRQSQKFLRGAIALCPSVAAVLTKWLRVPVLCIKHPTEYKSIRLWGAHNTCELWQAGFFLRNLRFIHCVHAPGYLLSRSQPYIGWQLRRDRKLAKIFKNRETGQEVTEVKRLSNTAYDQKMASSIVCMSLLGAAANNVVIECISRNTPLLVNRLPETEYYLGYEYPLFFDNIDSAGRLLSDRSRVHAAHQYLKNSDKGWMDARIFARTVKDFVDEL